MTKCRGANLKAGRFFLSDDNEENVSKIIHADRDDDGDATTNRCQIRNMHIFSAG